MLPVLQGEDNAPHAHAPQPSAPQPSAPQPDAPPSDWWRSLAEYAQAAEYQQYAQREFPRDASRLLPESRREFLKLMTASLLLAGAAGCRLRQPTEKIVPAARHSEQATPGVSTHYTTAYDFAGSALGLTVECRDGRPVKVEGNPLHPASRGATTVFAQAATLDLYDPDRARTPTLRGDVVGL
ncbi:MAG: TAT-variant-translocated molybdopterin oxidoreductase [Aureliella sp.]